MNKTTRQDLLEAILTRHSAMREGDQPNTLSKLESAIAPEASHTFTGADPERWRHMLSSDQKAALADQFPSFG